MPKLNHFRASKKPIFSIVIPVYNREDLISTCIDSVLWQTFPSYEVLIVDDASIDSTMTVVSAYAQQDSRIYAFSNQLNLGSQRSRNRGLSLAKGQYIVFLDSDDILSPHYLQIVYSAFSRHSWLELFSVNCIKGSGEASDLSKIKVTVDRLGNCCRVDLRTYLNNTYKWPTSCSSWDRLALLKLGGWDETLSLWQDWNLNARFLASGKTSLFFNKALVFYRLTNDGLSRKKGGKRHIPYIRSRISAWKSCRGTDLRISHRDEWLNHFLGAVVMCRDERSNLCELVISVYYSIRCWPSLKTLRRVCAALQK